MARFEVEDYYEQRCGFGDEINNIPITAASTYSNQPITSSIESGRVYRLVSSAIAKISLASAGLAATSFRRAVCRWSRTLLATASRSTSTDRAAMKLNYMGPTVLVAQPALEDLSVGELMPKCYLVEVSDEAGVESTVTSTGIIWPVSSDSYDPAKRSRSASWMELPYSLKISAIMSAACQENSRISWPMSSSTVPSMPAPRYS